MFCCLIAAVLLGPLGLWGAPRAKLAAGLDCCAGRRRTFLFLSMAAFGVAVLCLAMFVLAWFQPVPFRHICSVFTGS